MNLLRRPAWLPGLRTGKSLALGALSLALGLLFIVLGVMKFGHPGTLEAFARYGLPDWFRLTLGVAEVAGGVLLLLPRTGAYGACLLCVVVIVVAINLRLFAGVRFPLRPVALLVLLLVVGYLRRPGLAW